VVEELRQLVASLAGSLRRAAQYDELTLIGGGDAPCRDQDPTHCAGHRGRSPTCAQNIALLELADEVLRDSAGPAAASLDEALVALAEAQGDGGGA
jgi:hypothetical protein